MKIGIFDPYLDTLGGGEKYMLSIASCLGKTHTVEVFWDDPNILKEAHRRFALDFANVKVVPNIFSKQVSMLKRLRVTSRYDAIIYLSDGSIPLTFAKKLIVHFQFPVEWVSAGGLTTRIKLSRIDKIICNSKFTKRFIDRKFHVDSLVVYPPTDDIEETTLKENVILSVGRFGRLAEGKNFKKQDVLIDAFKSLVDRGLVNWKLVLAISFREADKDEVEKLKDMARGYPIEIVANIDKKSMHEFYAKARIFWHAAGFGEDIVTHPEWAEHFGIATVEAMSAGAVPVVMKAGGQVEIVDDGKNGFLFDTLDELEEKTLTLIHDQKLSQKLARDAQTKAKRFSKKRFCQEIYELVER